MAGDVSPVAMFLRIYGLHGCDGGHLQRCEAGSSQHDTSFLSPQSLILNPRSRILDTLSPMHAQFLVLGLQRKNLFTQRIPKFCIFWAFTLNKTLSVDLSEYYWCWVFWSSSAKIIFWEKINFMIQQKSDTSITYVTTAEKLCGTFFISKPCNFCRNLIHKK